VGACCAMWIDVSGRKLRGYRRPGARLAWRFGGVVPIAPLWDKCISAATTAQLQLLFLLDLDWKQVRRGTREFQIIYSTTSSIYIRRLGENNVPQIQWNNQDVTGRVSHSYPRHYRYPICQAQECTEGLLG
jgi:hypothetical protein